MNMDLAHIPLNYLQIWGVPLIYDKLMFLLLYTPTGLTQKNDNCNFDYWFDEDVKRFKMKLQMV